MTGARWVEDHSLEAPEGHRWMKPAPNDCPNCPCCTLALCQKATATLGECFMYLGSNADDQVRDAVWDCPCQLAEGTGLRAIYDLAAKANAGELSEADYQIAVAKIHAAHPLPGS